MALKSRPSLREIARVAGVSAMTVSHALRNHLSHVSPAEAVRIRKLAGEMGYSLNPYLSSWMRNVRQRRHVQDCEVVAYIVRRHLEEAYSRRFQAGGNRFGATAGYRMDTFVLSDYPNPAALFRILRHRGIRGVIVGSEKTPLPPELWQHNVVWAHSPPEADRADFVDNDYHEGMTIALKKLNEYGFRRIGYLSMELIDHHQRWEAAYLYHHKDVPAKNRVPVLREYYGPEILPKVERWLKVNRPDAVVCADNLLYHNLKEARRAPLDVAWASLGVASDPHLAGIDSNQEMLGEAAVRMVTRKMELNEIGPPEQPRTVIVRPSWHDGSTVVPKVSVRV